MTYRNALIERSRQYQLQNDEPVVLDYLQSAQSPVPVCLASAADEARTGGADQSSVSVRQDI